MRRPVTKFAVSTVQQLEKLVELHNGRQLKQKTRKVISRKTLHRYCRRFGLR